MKATLRLTLFLVFSLGLLVGCSKESSNKNQVVCDSWGNCHTPGTPGYPIAGGGVYNRNTIYLSGGVAITNKQLWQKVINGLSGCSSLPMTPNFCFMINDAAPKLDVVFNDYTFPNNVTSGGFTLYNMQILQRFGVNWRKINSDTQIGTELMLSYEEKGRFLYVQITGRPTDAQLAVQMFYGTSAIPENRFADGMLVRMNY